MVRASFLLSAVILAALPLGAGAALAGSSGHGGHGPGSGIAAHGAAGYGPNSPGIAAHGHSAGIWRGGHHHHRVLSGMVSQDNATQTRYVPPAVYKVEVDGRGARHSRRTTRGQFRVLSGPAGLRRADVQPVAGSFSAPPRVFVIKVPHG
jgi:hypothetical protein